MPANNKTVERSKRLAVTTACNSSTGMNYMVMSKGSELTFILVLCRTCATVKQADAKKLWFCRTCRGNSNIECEAIINKICNGGCPQILVTSW